MNRIFSGFIVVTSVLASNQVVRSQDYYNFVQFYVNPSLVNPAFTGIDGQPAAFLSYKKQWMGISGTPSIGNLSIQTPLPSKVSLGFGFNNDTRGLLSTTSLLLSASYYIPVATDQFVRFGFSLGAAWNKVDIDALNFGSTGDDVLTDLLSSNFTPLGNAGISFHSKTFQIGAAIPNIFQPTYLSKDAFTLTKVKPFESIILHTSYRLYFGRDMHAFEPYIMYRLNSSIPSQLEVAGIVHLHNIAWVGASYKQNFGISALAGYKISRLMGFGYSYTIKNTGINELSKPSHEIQLAMLFGVHQKKTPVYSFVNSEKEKGKKNTTHEKQQYYAKNNPKNESTVKTPGKSGGPRNTLSSSEPVAIDNPKTDPAKTDPVKTDPAKTDPAKTDPAKTDPAKTDPAKTDPAKTDPAKTDPAKTDPVKTDPVKTDPAKTDPVKTDPAKTDLAKTDPAKTDPAKTDPVKTDPTKTDLTKTDPAKTDPTKTDPTKTDPAKTDPTKTDPTKTNPTKTDPVKTDPVKTDPVKTDPAKTDPVKTDPAKTDPAKTEPVKTDPAKTDPVKTDPVKTEVTSEFKSKADSVQHFDEQEKLSRLTDHGDNPTEEHNEPSHGERHEFVKRGNHEKEMDLGDYVIVGVFRAEANAKHMTDELKKLGFSEVDYGYLTNKAVWYIHIAGSNDIEEARTKRNKYRKMKMFKDAWLLTVHQ